MGHERADNFSMQLDETLRASIAQRLRQFELQALSAPGSRRAAVALAIVEEGFGAALPGILAPAAWSGQAALLLTRRPSHMRNHASQWALPGGSIDGDETPEQAALRELHEEVGLQLGAATVLGRLDDFVTRSGFAITPIVVWAGAARDLVPSEAEVASIHRIPIAEFMRADAPLLDAIDDSVHPVLRMPVGDTWIAAPTAAFLYQFRELCIAGRATRVAHYEQPLFARK
ncbi:putative NUDIX hydrolase [Variovorax sp. PBL-H6]|nr:putative NUDIX hydrolase [Variovorax sp. PBL-H6]